MIILVQKYPRSDSGQLFFNSFTFRIVVFNCNAFSPVNGVNVRTHTQTVFRHHHFILALGQYFWIYVHLKHSHCRFQKIYVSSRKIKRSWHYEKSLENADLRCSKAECSDLFLEETLSERGFEVLDVLSSLIVERKGYFLADMPEEGVGKLKDWEFTHFNLGDK